MAEKLPSSLSEAEQRGYQVLAGAGQQHLFAAWPAGDADAEAKKAFLRSAAAADARYPGGLAAYVAKGKALLERSRAGANPLEGVVPEVPRGLHVGTFGADFRRLEAAGLAEVRDAAFVLVAGGLGERLGYDGIKIELPATLLTEQTYLSLYCEWIRFLQRASGAARKLPLVIMTSGDTHAKTVALLSRCGFFGLDPAQVTIVKQEKVPAMADNSARLVTKPGCPYELVTKPHGNGDVHLLLEQHGIAEAWKKDGMKWVVFFQDTNGLAFNTLLPTLGLSAQSRNAMTTVTVPRVAGEAIGCITALRRRDGSAVVCNVEYNQIDPLLRAVSGGKQGDVADPKTGFSAFPGNTNTLVMAAPRYAEVLRSSGGVMPEFVNPKYANAERTAFKAPTRLECMMEDYPKLLAGSDNVGFASFDRWASFSPCKNNLKDAAAKSAAGQDAWGAFSAEADFYRHAVTLLRGLGVRVAAPAERRFCGVAAPLGALVWLAPSFAGLLAALPRRLPRPSDVSISSRSALVVSGCGDVTIEALHLDGALVIDACEGAVVVVRALTVRNKGWELVEMTPAEAEAAAPAKQIRGYSLVRRDQLVLRFSHPGRFVVDDRAKL